MSHSNDFLVDSMTDPVTDKDYWAGADSRPARRDRLVDRLGRAEAEVSGLRADLACLRAALDAERRVVVLIPDAAEAVLDETRELFFFDAKGRQLYSRSNVDADLLNVLLGVDAAGELLDATPDEDGLRSVSLRREVTR